MTTLLTVAEAAEFLREHPKTVIDRIHREELRAYHNGRTGNGRRYRIERRDLERFLESRQVTA